MLEIDCYDCPYCGERVETTVDTSVGDQCYTEDCQVCCQPIVFILQVYDDHWVLEARREDDA